MVFHLFNMVCVYDILQRSSTNSLQNVCKFPKINNRTQQVSSPQKLVVNQSFETIPEDVSSR